MSQHSVQINNPLLNSNAPKGIPKLLWVDDDPNITNAIYRGLRPYLVDVLCAYHGMQGIWLAITEKPDLIVTDLSMPLASGNDLIETLSNNPVTRHIPMLVVTGLTSEQCPSSKYESPVVKVLRKPSPFNEMLYEIMQILPLNPRIRRKPAVESNHTTRG